MPDKNARMEESQEIEFKKSLAERKELLETISAFANSNGGKIFVGIEENKDGSIKEIVGIRIKGKEIENLSNEIKQNTDPVIFPSIAVKEIEGKSVLVIEVKESQVKPVFAKIDKIPVAFKRVGKTNQKADVNELRRIISEGKEFLWDSQICEEASLEDIDWEKVRWVLRKAKTERNLDIDPEISVKEALEKLNLTKNGKLTNAAILVFGKEPQKFFLQGEVRCARFKGLDVLEFEDMEVIKGTAIEQVERIVEFVKRNLKMEVTFGDQIERMEKWEYPLLAIKEAVTNAVCHRDYSLNSNVQVRIFDDRIEIWSPGGLPKGLSVEDLKRVHESIPRNKLIANVFFMVKYIEQWGTGTNRMIQWCLNEGLPEPEFEDKIRAFIVRIRKDIYSVGYLRSKGLSERQVRAVIYAKEKGKITNKDYQHLNNVSRQTAQRDLSELVNKEIFKKFGKGRVVHYTIK